MIRVGKCNYDSGKIAYPSYENFTPIVVMLKSHSKYYPLSPYFLKDGQNRIMENIWQFSKCYENVPETVQKKSKYDSTVIWKHGAEIHLDDNGEVTESYKKWRNKGMSNLEPVRYPVGFNFRHNCKFSLKERRDGTINPERMDYITSRKKIYVPVYCKLVKKEKLFVDLMKRLEQGENLLIIEVDGPHQESLGYYKEKYNVNDNFIENDTMLITKKNLKIVLNDEKHPFGHGYCLAMTLLGLA